MDVVGLDPTAEATRSIVAAHRAFAESVTPPELVFAVDPSAIDPALDLFGVLEAGAVLAIGGLRVVEPGHLEIKTMHTLASARGRGLGRIMLAALVAEAFDRGATRLSLETGTHPAFAPARALYRSFGFEPCPPFGDYPASEHSLCMRRLLD